MIADAKRLSMYRVKVMFLILGIVVIEAHFADLSVEEMFDFYQMPAMLGISSSSAVIFHQISSILICDNKPNIKASMSKFNQRSACWCGC